MSKGRMIALAINLAGFLVVGNAAGANFWTAMLGVILIDTSARYLGRNGG